MELDIVAAIQASTEAKREPADSATALRLEPTIGAEMLRLMGKIDCDNQTILERLETLIRHPLIIYSWAESDYARRRLAEVFADAMTAPRSRADADEI